MTRPKRLSEEDRASLVAFLDGELTGEAARTVEARLSLDPTFRAEADSLKRTWDLLDFLPRSEPSPSFTEKTLSKLAPLRADPEPISAEVPLSVPMARLTYWPRVLLGVAWAAGILVAVWIGYRGYQATFHREPGELELVRDLRLIENKRFYDAVEEFDFLRKLDDPDLFGDDVGGS